MITDDIFGNKPRDEEKFEYHVSTIEGLNALTPSYREDLERAAEWKLKDLTRQKGPGWKLYCVNPGTPVQFPDQAPSWPEIVFRRRRQP